MERPILFSGPMVRAILAGTKTQTRRVVTPQPFSNGSWSNQGHGNMDVVCHNDYLPPDAFMWQPKRGLTMSNYEDDWTHECSPYGKAGDRLWVRETWAHDAESLEALRSEVDDILGGGSHGPYFRADMAHENAGLTWRPSIHMFRWLSRILLEVTSVRVERLQDISDDDARAEGVTAAPFCKAGRASGLEHVESFETLWDSINGKRCPWDSNPWVWVVSFKRVTADG